jgi:hypothetical protein
MCVAMTQRGRLKPSGAGAVVSVEVFEGKEAIVVEAGGEDSSSSSSRVLAPAVRAWLWQVGRARRSSRGSRSSFPRTLRTKKRKSSSETFPFRETTTLGGKKAPPALAPAVAAREREPAAAPEAGVEGVAEREAAEGSGGRRTPRTPTTCDDE